MFSECGVVFICCMVVVLILFIMEGKKDKK